MFYDVKIIQTLEGYVIIEANSIEESIKIADKKYNDDGEELPDMEDMQSLNFEATLKKFKTGQRVFDKGCGEYGTVVNYTESGDVVVEYDHDFGCDSNIDECPEEDLEFIER